jgi:ketosteroid isomerase-like protein
MINHPHLDTIRTYFIGCSTGDVELMKSTFAPDITHYFTDMEPVKGADVLANFWLEYNLGDRRTVWTVDHGIVAGDEAVIEWTMIAMSQDRQPQGILLGAEWYQFRAGKIAEIRAYYHGVSELSGRELIDFPYAERGFPLFTSKYP